MQTQDDSSTDVEKTAGAVTPVVPPTQSQSEKSPTTDSAFLVQFEPNDPENPLNWSKKWKWGVTAAVAGTGFTRIMVSTVRFSHLFSYPSFLPSLSQ